MKNIVNLGPIAGLTRGMAGQAGSSPRVHARHAFPIDTKFLQIPNKKFVKTKFSKLQYVAEQHLA